MRRSPRDLTSRLQFVGLLLLASLVGCATQAPLVDAPAKADLQRVLEAPASIPTEMFAQPEVDLLALSAGMKQLVAQHIPKDADADTRLKILLDIFKHHPDYIIDYDANYTLTADETFRLARGNCLSFSSMFIAIAREAGLEVNFQEVDTPTTWDAMTQNVLVQYRHINVAVGSEKRPKGVVDFRIERYSRSYPQRVVSDATGLGHYYSNIGMDHLMRNELPQAYVALQRALKAAPDKSFIWNNMGIIQRRLGHLDLAEVSYQQALNLDPGDLSALTNLAGVYEEQGKLARATELRDYGYQIKLRDPYFRFALAQNAYHVGHYDEALRQLDVATRRYDVDHRFYYLRGLSFWQLGDERSAIDNVRKAIRIAAEQDSVGRYQRTLQEWTGT